MEYFWTLEFFLILIPLIIIYIFIRIKKWWNFTVAGKTYVYVAIFSLLLYLLIRLWYSFYWDLLDMILLFLIVLLVSVLILSLRSRNKYLYYMWSFFIWIYSLISLIFWTIWFLWVLMISGEFESEVIPYGDCYKKISHAWWATVADHTKTIKLIQYHWIFERKYQNYRIGLQSGKEISRVIWSVPKGCSLLEIE